MFLVCAGLSGVLKLDERTLLKLLQPLPNAGPRRTERSKRLSVRRGRSKTAAWRVSGLYMNQEHGLLRKQAVYQKQVQLVLVQNSAFPKMKI